MRKGVVLTLAVGSVCLACASHFGLGPDLALAGGHPGSPQQTREAPPAGEAPKAPTNAEAKKAQERGCPGQKVRRVDNEHAHEPAVAPTRPIEFAVHETSSVINFGSSRDVRANYIVLKASREIPRGIYSTDFEIDSLEPIRRIGEASLESVHLKPPTFTPPHFFNHRREIGFNLCVTSANGHPGTYTGQFQFIGPGAIQTATLTQTAQLKAQAHDFVWRWLLVLAIALALLFVTIIIQPGWPRGGSEWCARLAFVFVSLGASALAMLIAFSQNPTWGENIWVATAALITTAFGAAGLGGTLTAAAARINPDPASKAHLPKRRVRKPRKPSPGSGGEPKPAAPKPKTDTP